MASDAMPELKPLLLSNLSYSAAVKQMRLTGCAVRRPHWCDPVLIWWNDRVMMDDGEEFLTWEPTGEDERASDWLMVAREEPSDDR